MAAFDKHHPPAPELIDQCVHCGFCLPACPTYALWGQEMDSPRGRIYLMKMASEGNAAMTPEWVSHMDRCLGCVSCMTACPSGVDYGKLIEATRAQVERLHPRTSWDRLHRSMIFALFPRVDRLRLLRPLLSAYQKLGIRALLHGTGLMGLFPKRLRAMEELLPELGPKGDMAPVVPAEGPRRGRAGLMLGCVQREFLPEINAATARVLSREGFEVVAPPEQPCCGALLTHAGQEEGAVELAKRFIDAFEAANVDVIVTNAGGCGSSVREYGHLLRDTDYAERALRFSAKCRDVSEVLTGVEPRAERHEVKLRVAYHDSCHLQHAQKVRSQPRQLLAQIPGLEVVELPESSLCCGSAGIYNLVEPETAGELADRKAAHIAAAEPNLVVTGNAGCLLQLQTALRRGKRDVPVFHTIQLLDASIRNRNLTEA